MGAFHKWIEADCARLILANTDKLQTRVVIIQGRAFGEHQILSVLPNSKTERITVGGKYLNVTIGLSSVLRLNISMKRYANDPSYDTPWEKAREAVDLISPRRHDTTAIKIGD